MKNNFLLEAALLCVVCMFSMSANAQLEVESSGDVRVTKKLQVSGTTTFNSNISVGTNVQSGKKLYVYSSGSGGGNQYGTYSKINWGNAGNKYAVYGYCTGGGGSLIGVHGEASATTDVKAYGVYGVAGGATGGKNYGVFGSLKTDNTFGAGVYGTNDGTIQQLSDRYAGYFRGETYVNGNLSSLTSRQTSDARLKTNIRDIKTEAIQKVKYLHPIQYQWQQVEEVVKNDTATIKVQHFSKDIDLKQQHYGFLAQELQKLFPELVQKEGDGYLSVNYIELIPIMVQALQELSAEVDILKQEKNAHRTPFRTSIDDNSAILYQNSPNPFSDETRIEYLLPLTTQTASIHVYDINGKQLAEYPILSYGNGSISISAKH